MSKKLTLLKASLAKKKALLDQKFEQHFSDVKRANGQPLNDKRNGQATLTRWDKQNDAIRNLKSSIDKTEKAIEREQSLIDGLNYVNDSGSIPKQIMELVNSGTLVQWKKHPNIFFVNGVEKGRIIWDGKHNIVAHKFYSSIPDIKQREKFAKVFNPLGLALNGR